MKNSRFSWSHVWSHGVGIWEGAWFRVVVGFAACAILIDSGRLNAGSVRFFFLPLCGLCCFVATLPRTLASIAAGIRRYRAVVGRSSTSSLGEGRGQ